MPLHVFGDFVDGLIQQAGEERQRLKQLLVGLTGDLVSVACRKVFNERFLLGNIKFAANVC